MKVGKVNFFKRVYLAITDFRMYPFIQKEKLKTAIGYFCKLLLVLTVIMGTFLTNRLYDEIPYVITLCQDNMPDFSIENGILKAEENVQKEWTEDCYLVVKDDAKYTDLKTITFQEEKEHMYYIVVLSDATTVGIRTEEGILELGTLVYGEDMNFTRTDMVMLLQNWQDFALGRIAIWLVASLSLFLAFLFVRIWTLIMYMISVAIINLVFALKLKWKDYLKIAIYISTLPFILETIAIIVVGGVSQTINFITILISCVYIFYALRALKLDSFIIKGSGVTAEEKIKNALLHAQQELEKQLEEIEKEESKKKKETTGEKNEMNETSETKTPVAETEKEGEVTKKEKEETDLTKVEKKEEVSQPDKEEADSTKEEKKD